MHKLQDISVEAASSDIRMKISYCEYNKRHLLIVSHFTVELHTCIWHSVVSYRSSQPTLNRDRMDTRTYYYSGVLFKDEERDSQLLVVSWRLLFGEV